jgi:hypothetical protein
MSGAEPAPARELPSDRRYPGDTRQVGFSADPDRHRIDGAVGMLTDLARDADEIGAVDGECLRVCLTLVRLPIGLPFELFGFHLASIGSDGVVVDEVSPEHEILYALVVNQPVGLMREVAVRFLLDLVSRQAPIQQVMQDQRSVDELPRLIAATDASNAELGWDLPPEAAQVLSVVGERAADVKLRLQVRFQLDPFADQHTLAVRVPALRALYNSEQLARDAINRTVSAIGARHASLRGGREDVRGFLRRQTTLQGMRQYMNQTVRDAEVCGNGYLHTEMTGLDAELRCLQPEHVRIGTNGTYRYTTDSGTEVLQAERVLHLLGLGQIDSPYGISILEPLLYVLARRKIVSSVRAASEQMPPGANETVRLQTSQMLSAVAQIDRETDEKIERLLAFFPRGLAAASEDLYFPGQETYR